MQTHFFNLREKFVIKGVRKSVFALYANKWLKTSCVTPFICLMSWVIKFWVFKSVGVFTCWEHWSWNRAEWSLKASFPLHETARLTFAIRHVSWFPFPLQLVPHLPMKTKQNRSKQVKRSRTTKWKHSRHLTDIILQISLCFQTQNRKNYTDVT